MRFLSRLLSVGEAMLDVILPLRARTARAKQRTLEDIPLSPTPHDLLGVRITTLMNYRERAVVDLIQSLKYDGSAHAVRLASAVLADYLREEISSAHPFSARKIFLVPVPLHKHRANERGFNQIELVLKALPQEFHNGTLAYMEAGFLARTRAT